MTPARGPVDETGDDFQRLLEVASEMVAQAVTEDTEQVYSNAFANVWVPFCEHHGYSPYGSPPDSVVAFLDDAAHGKWRRHGRGPARSGALSPGYVDAVFAAVRHLHVVAGRPTPFDAYSGEEMASLRRAYRRRYANQARQEAPSPVMTSDDLVTLCETPWFGIAHHGAIAIAGLLSLDAQANLDDLVWLKTSDVQPGTDGAITIGFRHHQVTLVCRHELAQRIRPACAACLTTHYYRLKAGSDPEGAFLAQQPDHAPGSPVFRAWMSVLLRRAAASSAALSLARGRGRVRVEYSAAASERAALGARQLLAVAPTQGSRGLLAAQTAIKLVAHRGLTAADLFDRLTVAKVRRSSEDPSAVELQLRDTVRGREQEVSWLTVQPSSNPALCPVTALTEWLLVREAAAGQPLRPDAGLFVGSAGWADGSAQSITMGAARVQFRKLLEAAGLAEMGYRWESAQKLHGKTLYEQGATEANLYYTLRRRNPQHVARLLAEVSSRTAAIGRRAAGDAPRGNR
ncbi:hypothetical protein [Nocardioides sp. URHA0032]|uniref:hypothetical protein n=1 Tax=Nocardioides sp. URHA0032 TaxID=1380388 RepID=UPI00048C897F|nr:hypothetical protein [Nocardioides sp. URHA0032]